MQRNPFPKRFHVVYSEIFEAGIYRLEHEFPFIMEALDDVDLWLERSPEQAGETISIFPERYIMLMATPKTRRYPSLRILYEINEKRVVCWHASTRP